MHLFDKEKANVKMIKIALSLISISPFNCILIFGIVKTKPFPLQTKQCIYLHLLVY